MSIETTLLDAQIGATVSARQGYRDRPVLDDSVTARLNMIAAEIRHEHELIGQRMTWLVTSQSFLFGTFATLIGQRSVALAVDLVRLRMDLIVTSSTQAALAAKRAITTIPIVVTFVADPVGKRPRR